MKQFNLKIAIAPVLAVILMAAVLTSGLVNINFQHNLHLPKEFTNQTRLVMSGNWAMGKQLDIYFKTVIKDQFEMQDLLVSLDSLGKGDKAVFHLAGQGGSGEVLVVIANHIKQAQDRGVKVIMNVEGDVYSAHAFLATIGDEMRLGSGAYGAYMYFHTVSIFETNCSIQKGKDRADSNAAVCQLMKNEWILKTNTIIEGINLLPRAAKDRIIKGHAVIVKWEKDRLVWVTTDDSIKELPLEKVN